MGFTSKRLSLSEKPERIWVLGGKASSADDNIPWQKEIPNVANSDKLIVDLNTIPSGVAIPEYELRDYLRYMMMSGKVIYVILPSLVKNANTRIDMFPVFPTLIEIKPCDYDSINPLDTEDAPSEITEYCKYIGACRFFIDDIDCIYLRNALNPESGWNLETYPFSREINSIEQVYTLEILNVSYQPIGLASKYVIRNGKGKSLHETGQIIFLPPPSIITSGEAVEILVNSLRGREFREEEPDWISNVHLPETDRLGSKISEEMKIVKKATEKIQQLTKEKAEIEKHRELLWTFDKPLENAVKDAFFLLGFKEIREGRARGLEDWVIDFESTDELAHGVLEVKGRVKRTSLADMNQCFKWVNQYRVKEKKKVKGIFVHNQFRRTEPLGSKKRLKFELNEIEFSRDFKICILSTSELFKAVVHILGGKKLSRNEIEKRILEANPICKLVE